MRILAVGNMYPPHSLGGYELVWRSAMLHAGQAGHRVRVLTSDYRAPGVAQAAEEDDPDVHRELRWYWREHRFPRLGLPARVGLERANATTLDRHLREFQPDVVSWWAMGGMSLSLIERVRQAGLPGVGFVHDDWMLYGPKVDGWMRLCDRVPRPLRAALERATGIPARFDPGAAGPWHFVSEHTRTRALAAGLELPDAEVAHSGIDSGLFGADPPEPSPWRWRLLYVGRVDRRKGIDTAIEALARLRGEATLTVVGSGDPEALAELRALAEAHGVASRVTLAGGRPRQELPDLYAEADVLVFPVRWEEPWGLVPLEAMAVGTPVVATGTGGSGEYLREGENCLLFAAGDSEGLAAALERLAGDEALRSRLRDGGLATAPRYTERSFNRAVAEALERAAPRSG